MVELKVGSLCRKTLGYVSYDYLIEKAGEARGQYFCLRKSKTSSGKTEYDHCIFGEDYLQQHYVKTFDSFELGVDYLLGMTRFSRVLVIERPLKSGRLVCGIVVSLSNKRWCLENLFGKGRDCVNITPYDSHDYKVLDTFTGKYSDACQAYCNINDDGVNCLNNI